MDFALLLLLLATFFCRPQDFVPELADQPLYLGLLLICGLVSWPAILDQLTSDSLKKRPITVCVLGLLPAIVLSHLTQFSIWGARTSGSGFARVLLFYLVVVAALCTPTRFQRFLAWLAACILAITVLAMLEYHQVISLPQLTTLQERYVNDDTGEETVIPRLRTLGLFNDPNDLSLLLLLGMGISLYRAGQPSSGIGRLPWLGCLLAFGYALALTQSRGGLLGLLIAILVLLKYRFGWWKAGGLAAVAVPVLLVLFAGRQTDLNSTEHTAQERIQMWSEGLSMLKSAPFFGIGQGLFEDEAGLVAHNSYLHCFAELGLFGGMLFLGAFVAALWSLHRLGTCLPAGGDPELKRLHPYLVAMTAAYAAGIMSLSRSYIPPTYLLLALVTAYTSLLAQGRPTLPLPAFDLRFLRRLTMVSVLFLVAMKVFVRFSLQRS
jgi:O-antigen ligase